MDYANDRCLVIQHSAAADARRLGEWLTDAGLRLHVVRAYAGDEIPTDLAGFVALLVLGGRHNAYRGPDGEPDAAWLPAVESLLRLAVRARVPTLGVCLGAQQLAVAHAGTVAPAAAGPEYGARLVARRDAAERDPLFGPLPLMPDVVVWHRDEVTELPLGAVLLAASTSHPVQAFRVGECAWGTQFHLECDTDMIADWAAKDGASLAGVGITADEVVREVDSIMDDLFEVWQPFAYRFATLALGGQGPVPVGRVGLGRPESAPGRELPLLGR